MALRENLTVSITPELRAFIQGCLSTGRYSSASEVVRAGLRLLEPDEVALGSAVRRSIVVDARTLR